MDHVMDWNKREEILKTYKILKGKPLFKIEGTWTQKVTVNGKSYYQFDKLRRFKIVDAIRSLPSDASKRKDIQKML